MIENPGRVLSALHVADDAVITGKIVVGVA